MISEVDIRDWEKSIKAARTAIDDLDDFAKMEASVDPIGARNFLQSFVDRVEAAVYFNQKQIPALCKPFKETAND